MLLYQCTPEMEFIPADYEYVNVCSFYLKAVCAVTYDLLGIPAVLVLVQL